MRSHVEQMGIETSDMQTEESRDLMERVRNLRATETEFESRLSKKDKRFLMGDDASHEPFIAAGQYAQSALESGKSAEEVKQIADMISSARVELLKDTPDKYKVEDEVSRFILERIHDFVNTLDVRLEKIKDHFTPSEEDVKHGKEYIGKLMEEIIYVMEHYKSLREKGEPYTVGILPHLMALARKIESGIPGSGQMYKEMAMFETFGQAK